MPQLAAAGRQTHSPIQIAYVRSPRAWRPSLKDCRTAIRLSPSSKPNARLLELGKPATGHNTTALRIKMPAPTIQRPIWSLAEWFHDQQISQVKQTRLCSQRR